MFQVKLDNIIQVCQKSSNVISCIDSSEKTDKFTSRNEYASIGLNICYLTHQIILHHFFRKYTRPEKVASERAHAGEISSIGKSESG